MPDNHSASGQDPCVPDPSPAETDLTELRELVSELTAERDRYQQWLNDILADPGHTHTRFNLRDGQYLYRGAVDPSLSKYQKHIETLASQTDRDIFELWKERFHPDDWSIHLESLEEARKRQVDGVAPYQYVARIRILDEYRWLHLSGLYHFDEQGSLVERTTCTTDIIQQREIESQLKRAEEYARQIENTIPVGLISVTDGTLSYGNRAFREMFGFDSSADFIGEKAEILHELPEDRPPIVEAIRTGQHDNITWRAKRRDGSLFWANSNVVAFKEDDDSIARIDATIFDVTSEVENRRDLELNMKYQRALLESSRILLSSDPKSGDPLSLALEILRKANDASRAAIYMVSVLPDGQPGISLNYQAASDPSLMQNVELPTPAVPMVPTFQRWLSHLKKREMVEDTYQSAPDYERSDWDRLGVKSLLGIPLYIRDEWVGWLIYSDFESQRHWLPSDRNLLQVAAEMIGAHLASRRNEEQLRKALNVREIMLKEINHRVKNNLQIVASLLDMQRGSASSRDDADMFGESRDRISAMARIHDRLQFDATRAVVDFHDYISNLAHSLFSTYNVEENRVDLQVDVDATRVKLDTAVPCALMINEMLSNSLKYAFPDGRKGMINIRFAANNGRYILQVEDDGIGMDCPSEELNELSSLGLRIIHLLADQLHADIEVKSENGVQYTVHIPNDPMADAG